MKSILKNQYVSYVLIVLPYLLMVFLYWMYQQKLKQINNSSFIIIDKNTMKLSQYNFKGELLQQSPVATGKNYGNKTKRGDLKTPEGIFSIQEILNASSWKHDFKDDTLGEIAGAYGPYFIRLNVLNQKGIGIHGTHDNTSLGTRASEGCIRMKNEDLVKLVNRIGTGTSSIVVITPAQEDVNVNNDTTKIKPVADNTIKEKEIQTKNTSDKSELEKKKETVINNPNKQTQRNNNKLTKTTKPK
jgi:hypothetical protein